MVPATSKLKLRRRWNASHPSAWIIRERKVHRYIHNRDQTKRMNNIMTKQARELLLLPNKRRHKQGKRQRGASQEELETLRIMKLPTCWLLLLVWRGWLGQVYLYRHTCTTQTAANTTYVPGIEYYSKIIAVMFLKIREGICPRRKIYCREKHAHCLPNRGPCLTFVWVLYRNKSK